MCERWARSAAARSHAGTVVASGAGVDQAAGCNACLVPPGERGRHVELQRPDSGVPVVVEELGGEVAVAGRGGPYDAHEHARHGRPQLEPRREADAGGAGSRGVLEVRCHEAPFVLEHGQIVGRLVYEHMAAMPDALYGREIKSNYQGQGLKQRMMVMVMVMVMVLNARREERFSPKQHKTCLPGAMVTAEG